MRKKLAGGMLAAAGVLVLGLTGTYAGFTATESAPDFMTEGGTLNLRLSNAADGITPQVSFTGIRPGPEPTANGYQQSELHYFVRLTNEGTVPGRAQWGFSDIFERENTCFPPEVKAGDLTCAEPGYGIGQQQLNRDGELGGQLRVLLSVMAPGVCSGVPLGSVLPELFPPTDDARLNDIRVGQAGAALTLQPDESRCVKVDVYFLDRDYNNLAQSDSSRWRFRFALTT